MVEKEIKTLRDAWKQDGTKLAEKLRESLGKGELCTPFDELGECMDLLQILAEAIKGVARLKQLEIEERGERISPVCQECKRGELMPLFPLGSRSGIDICVCTYCFDVCTCNGS